MPELSIVMPMFNAAAYVAQTVESLLNQTFRDFELIVVDDASTDGCADLVHAYADPRIKVLVNPQNMGIVYSRNRGLDAASGRYYAPFDADDVAMPTKYAQQIHFLSDNFRFGMVGCWAKKMDAKGNPLPDAWKLPAKPEQIPSILLFHNYFVHSGTLIRRSALPEGGYRAGFDIGEDYMMWVDIARRMPVWNLPAYLVTSRQHPSSATNRDPAVLVAYERKVLHHIYADFGMALSASDCRALLQLKGSLPWSHPADLDALEHLLLTVIHNNTASRAYHPAQLRKTVRNRWLKACYKASPNIPTALIRFLRSPIACTNWL